MPKMKMDGLDGWVGGEERRMLSLFQLLYTVGTVY